MQMRTDAHRNPTAFTTDLAKEAGLVLGVDYEIGEPFTVAIATPPLTLYTAKLLGDPIATTIRVINQCGFYTKNGSIRWEYIAIPYQIWINILSDLAKAAVIGGMYRREGGTEMTGLFSSSMHF